MSRRRAYVADEPAFDNNKRPEVEVPFDFDGVCAGVDGEQDHTHNHLAAASDALRGLFQWSFDAKTRESRTARFFAVAYTMKFRPGTIRALAAEAGVSKSYLAEAILDFKAHIQRTTKVNIR